LILSNLKGFHFNKKLLFYKYIIGCDAPWEYMNFSETERRSLF